MLNGNKVVIIVVTVADMQTLTLVLCVLCVATNLVFSMPVEQSQSAVQVPLNQQVSQVITNITLYTKQ